MQRKKLLVIVFIVALAVIFFVARAMRPQPEAAPAGAAGAGGGAGGPGANGAPPAPPVPVSVLTAQPGAMDRTVEVVGQLRSDTRVTLTSKVAGKLDRLPVSTGDRVRQGQLVAHLDDSDASAQLHQAEATLVSAEARYQQARAGVSMKDVQTSEGITGAQANLASAKARLQQAITNAKIEDAQADVGVQQAKSSLAAAQENLSQIQEGARQQERSQAAIAVERAQADYNQAKDNFDRQDSLFKAGAVSQQSRDATSYALQAAKAALDSAKEQASLVQAGSRSQQVAVAQQQVRQSQAALHLAEAQVARRAWNRQDVRAAEEQVRQLETMVRIARSGTAQYAMTRQDVRAAAAAVQLAQAQLELARQQLANANIYSPVAGVVDTRPVSIGSSISPTTVLMTISPTRGLYFEAEVPEGAIAAVRIGAPVATTVDALPGQTLTGRVSDVIPVAEAGSKVYRVHVALPAATGALPENGFARGRILLQRVEGIIIPRDSLASAVGDYYVFVVEGNHVHRRDVTVGLTDDVRAQILSGLKAGDVYVVAGKDAVTDRAEVVVKPDSRVL